ncbi:MAG: flippase-like domain-containing protein, partial [Actinomycetia bacterium]|nr:flippase-like domain-containing protein [Actinomycetes bacterium]
LTVKYLSFLVFKGLFFNNFLPGSIGGDTVRFLELGKRIKNNTASFSSILSERVLSSITLGLISLISGLLVFKAIGEIFNWILIFSFACLVVFVLFIFTPRLFVSSSHGFIEKYKLKDVSEEILKIKSTKIVLQVIFLSLLFQFSLVVINWAIFLGLDVQINPVFYFLFIPITQAVSLIPFSFNGLGFREGSYIFLFGYVGLSQAVSLAAAISFFIIVALLSLFGGVIFVLNK